MHSALFLKIPLQVETMKFSKIKIVAVICILAIGASGQSGPTLPVDEVEALRVIGSTLGKTDWDFSVDPCSADSRWITPNIPNGFGSNVTNNVTCDCSFENDTICHVVSIMLSSQNLGGTLPAEIVNLPFLQHLDLSPNYLSGIIPTEWGSTILVYINLNGNRVTGPIPRELANITTLEYLGLDFNQLSGTIPVEFGNLARIQKMMLCSNYLTGELPESLGNLIALQYFRISDNNFIGSIPNFIENWTQLQSLHIQGSGLSGPIPSGISSLINLTDLRISDLSGNEPTSSLPPLSNMTHIKTLILKSCSIVGQIPHFLGNMTSLQILDLSFNNLTGPIPDNFESLRGQQIFLTGNSIDGPIPAWMQTEGGSIDLSYNNFSSENSPTTCQPRNNLNLFASSKGNTTGIVSCLGISRCRRIFYSLHINCDGEEISNGNYEADTMPGGASNAYISNTNWAFSSTGNFLDTGSSGITNYILSNTSSIVGQNPQLYMNARMAPISLTYYGYCLQNGNYTVTLHFAEIVFTVDGTFGSLGRRIFDIYIQGTLVRKDFNIVNQAGGVSTAITINFTAVVNDSTLDIRFFWAGKGTNRLPRNGVYGPIISAISVDPDFRIPSQNRPSNGNSISTGALVGIMVGIFSGVVLCLGILWWIGCLRGRNTLETELKGVNLQTTSFSLRKIKAATNDFDSANKIGEGGFGPVYKGLLSDGTAIAVKMLSAKSKQGNREFLNEIGLISAVQHPCLVKLYGCCIDGNLLLLIYEYMENNSLARALFGPEEHQIHLDWPTRHKICIGMARGLAYLHEESRLKIVHRDIKATNVLLDKNLGPKISDFGLAKLDEEENTHMSTRIAGTYGYMAPEYAMMGHLSDKSDVYSFGVVLLEVVSGRPNTTKKTKEESFYLLDWINSLKESGNFMELVDPRLGSKLNEREILTTIKVALQCTNDNATERPSMSTVVSILEGKTGIQESAANSHVSVGKMNIRNVDNGEQGKGVSVDVPLTGSSTSVGDLYPVTLDSDYLEKRVNNV